MRWLSRLALVGLLVCAPLLGLEFVGRAPAQPVNPGLATFCGQAVIYDASTSGATKLVTGTATKQIYVCGFNFFAGGTVNVSLKYGTGTNCGTGTTAITPAYQLIAQTGLVDHQPYYAGLTPVPASNDLCINASAGTAVQAVVYYAQF